MSCLQSKMSKKLLDITLRLFLLFVVLSTVTNCSALEEIKLTLVDNKHKISLKKNQTLAITLEANPTTGFNWELSEPINEKVLRQLGKIEFKPESDLLGAPGVQIIRFKGVNPGKTALKLVYRRPWEKGVKPPNTFSVRVVVK